MSQGLLSFLVEFVLLGDQDVLHELLLIQLLRLDGPQLLDLAAEDLDLSRGHRGEIQDGLDFVGQLLGDVLIALVDHHQSPLRRQTPLQLGFEVLIEYRLLSYLLQVLMTEVLTKHIGSHL